MGKKIFKIMISVLIVCSLLAGCNNYKYGPLSGDYTSTEPVVSNGGFVAQYGDYTYFINGIDFNYSDNTFGEPVKASLMRVKTTQLSSEDAEYQIVVPRLLVTGAYNQGFYISGDYVYYATPTNAKDKAGTVQYSYLDFTRTKLDGTDTYDKRYFWLDDNTVDYRFMEINNIVYIVYVKDNDIYSYNTSTKTTTTIVDDAAAPTSSSSSSSSSSSTSTAAAVILPSVLGETTIYYTKAVTEKLSDDKENTLSYNEIYSIDGDGSNNRLLISGLGKSRDKNPLTTIDINNKMMTLIKAENGYIYFTAVENYNESSEYGYVVKVSDLTIDGNDESDAAEIENFFKAEKINNLTYMVDSTIFIENSTMIYYDSTNIVRYNYSYDALTDICTETTVPIVKNSSSPTMLYLNGDYAYYTESGTDGSKLYRINFIGEEENYLENYSHNVTYYEKEQIGDIEYENTWYAPEIIGNTLFFANANSTLAFDYVYIFDLTKRDTETNESYKAQFIGTRSDADQESYNTAYETAYEAALDALEALADKSDKTNYEIALAALNKLKDSFTQANYEAAFEALTNLKTDSNKTLYETALTALKSL